jgi:hypothetical protein
MFSSACLQIVISMELFSLISIPPFTKLIAAGAAHLSRSKGGINFDSLDSVQQ